jgi:hypothetical protein
MVGRGVQLGVKVEVGGGVLVDVGRGVAEGQLVGRLVCVGAAAEGVSVEVASATPCGDRSLSVFVGNGPGVRLRNGRLQASEMAASRSAASDKRRVLFTTFLQSEPRTGFNKDNSRTFLSTVARIVLFGVKSFQFHDRAEEFDCHNPL